MAYGIAAYSKGEVFLAQLGYVIGEDNLKKTLKLYFDYFSLKHPTPVTLLDVLKKFWFRVRLVLKRLDSNNKHNRLCY